MKRRRFVPFFQILIFWMVIGIVHSFQSYLYNRGLGSDCNVFSFFGYYLPEYVLWAIYSMFIFHLVKRFPIRNDDWMKAAFIHLSCSVLITIFHLFIILSTRWIFYKTTGTQETLKSYHEYMLINSLSSFFVPFLLYFGTTVVGYALDYYNKYQRMELKRVELERLLIGSRLESIKNHLHPHFLFNTLNTISMLVRRDDKKKAVEIIACLGDLLRYILENRENNWTTLGHELEIIELYLGIEQTRFQDRLSCSIDVPEELHKTPVPDLLLQPLVENALKHGLKDKAINGQLRIASSVNNGHLWLIISDNGKGFNTEKNREGFGLTSTRERLEKLYNGEAQMEIESEPGNGTKVSLLLPLQIA